MKPTAVKKYLSEIGKKGGDATKRKMPAGHFSAIGKLGGRPKKKVEELPGSEKRV